MLKKKSLPKEMTLVDKAMMVLISVRNRIILGRAFKCRMSPKQLFVLQYSNGELNRYDVIVRYIMLAYLDGKNEIGEDIYMRMQMGRAGNSERLKKEFSSKKQSLENLSKSLKADGYHQRSYILLNSNDQLCDGSHRLAAALYHNIPLVSAKRSQDIECDYGLDRIPNLSDGETALIRQIEQEILESINLTDVLRGILKTQSQQFGRGTFYQSFEDEGIKGQRPTTERFQTYELKKYLKPEMNVLDIGCNCGFFSLYASRFVKTIDGVEFNPSLVKIANISKLLLKIENATFTQGDFNKVRLEKKYDFIFSFAVHYWIGQDITQYAQTLWNLLNNNGYILFESQNIEKQDADWDKKTKAFFEAGFEEVSKGSLCDDGVIKRKFSLFRKSIA